MENFEKILQESAEFQTKLTKGAQVAANLGEVQVGTTAKELIHRIGNLGLYRYEPLQDDTSDCNPLLIIYALGQSSVHCGPARTAIFGAGFAQGRN